MTRKTPKSDSILKRLCQAGAGAVAKIVGGNIMSLERRAIAADSALKKAREEWQDARIEGRRECIAILLRMDAETALDEYIGTESIGDTGDYGNYWKVEDLRKLFNADERQSIHEWAESAYWEARGEMIDLECEVKRLKAALNEVRNRGHLYGTALTNSLRDVIDEALTRKANPYDSAVPDPAKTSSPSA